MHSWRWTPAGIPACAPPPANAGIPSPQRTRGSPVGGGACVGPARGRAMRPAGSVGMDRRPRAGGAGPESEGEMSGRGFNLQDYATVDDRITKYWAMHPKPEGSIQTEIIWVS